MLHTRCITLILLVAGYVTVNAYINMHIDRY